MGIESESRERKEKLSSYYVRKLRCGWAGILVRSHLQPCWRGGDGHLLSLEAVSRYSPE